LSGSLAAFVIAALDALRLHFELRSTFRNVCDRLYRLLHYSVFALDEVKTLGRRRRDALTILTAYPWEQWNLLLSLNIVLQGDGLRNVTRKSTSPMDIKRSAPYTLNGAA
jgi:hypothetical protein